MSPSFDRRRTQRYSISLDAQYTVRKRGKVTESGQIKIQNVCRTGIFFECPTAIPVGSVLQVIIDWPVMFEGKTPVQWVVDCVAVRSTSSGTAAQIMRQRFERSMKKKRKWSA